MPSKKRAGGRRRIPPYSPQHADAIRNRIRGTLIAERLQRFALGESGVDMSREQVAAAIALLRKVCPDLTAVEARVGVGSYIELLREVAMLAQRRSAPDAPVTVVIPALPEPAEIDVTPDGPERMH